MSEKKEENAKGSGENFELTVEGKLENLSKIGEFIDQTMRRLGIDGLGDIYAVQLSVDEACTNIIQHGYSNKSEGRIVIRCMLADDKFIVDIVDWGQYFDPTTLPKPDTESGLNQRKTGGLGIYFMRKFMDEINYNRCEDMNLLTIAKYIKK